MMPIFRIVLVFAAVLLPLAAYSQTPKLEPGVSHDLAKWRAAHYGDVQYKLNLTLEKMSPVLKGTIEIRVVVRDAETPGRADAASKSEPGAIATGYVTPIILDWRKIKGHEKDSTITNVSINGCDATVQNHPVGETPPPLLRKEGSLNGPPTFTEYNEHLIFSDGVIPGENVIKLDFTSPILTSGSAVTRYIDKEDGSEYIYSLFVPSDASTAFPVFDQPDLKARFTLSVVAPIGWTVVSNTNVLDMKLPSTRPVSTEEREQLEVMHRTAPFAESAPISTYLFSFAVGEFTRFAEMSYFKDAEIGLSMPGNTFSPALASKIESGNEIFVRKSQAEKFKPHAAEVFRLNRAAVKFFEEYFDYKFPFPKYDIVLIPEFPFGGMEHAGATFLRESSVIFPQEPTKNDEISRATLIFHETAHQWFGDTVTMRWFDDLWLKEGFANFMAYKALEKIMPESNAWKVFYERIKQPAYATDSTKGTTPIYQKIDNLSAAKSAYGNIVYNKAPAFLRQAEFYIGEDNFQTAVRAFLKKHEFGNATWEDLVKEFAEIGWKRPTDCMPIEECKKIAANGRMLIEYWAKLWVSLPGVFKFRVDANEEIIPERHEPFGFKQEYIKGPLVRSDAPIHLPIRFKFLAKFVDGASQAGEADIDFAGNSSQSIPSNRDTNNVPVTFFFPNYGDYGYGIFLLDEKSREYVLKNIQNEKDPFLRSMMWGALWDSVREGELDPKEYVKLAVKILSPGFSRQPPKGGTPNNVEDESTTALLLNRVGTALNYYLSEPGAIATGSPKITALKNPVAIAPGSDLWERVEDMLVTGMVNAKTQGMRITYYRAFLNVAGSEKARGVLKEMLKLSTTPSAEAASTPPYQGGELKSTPSAEARIPLKTKDKFDIVTRLIILGDPEALKLLGELEKTETSDDAKRYAYAARAGIATPDNKAKYWNDFISNKDISESWIEAALGPWNSLRQSDLTLPYLERALKELPNHKRSRKIFFVNGWLGAFIGGQRSEEALGIINKFLADNPKLDNDLRLKILENADVIERAVKIRKKF